MTFIKLIIGIFLFQLLFYNNAEAFNIDEDYTQDYEITLILLTSSTCPSSNHVDFPDLFQEIKNIIKSKSDDLKFDFMTIGVSINNINILNGLQHLVKFGNFDEIVVSEDWSNTGSIKYLYNDMPGTSSIPQMIVTKRSYNIINEEHRIRHGILDEIEVIRVIGLENIKRWVSNGIPLPVDRL